MSFHKAEKDVVLPALVKIVDILDAEGGAPRFQSNSPIEELSSVRVVV